jgi:hypothetical protein
MPCSPAKVNSGYIPKAHFAHAPVVGKPCVISQALLLQLAMPVGETAGRVNALHFGVDGRHRGVHEGWQVAGQKGIISLNGGV